MMRSWGKMITFAENFGEGRLSLNKMQTSLPMFSTSTTLVHRKKEKTSININKKEISKS